jgi:hypothetical protein
LNHQTGFGREGQYLTIKAIHERLVSRTDEAISAHPHRLLDRHYHNILADLFRKLPLLIKQI